MRGRMRRSTERRGRPDALVMQGGIYGRMRAAFNRSSSSHSDTPCRGMGVARDKSQLRTLSGWAARFALGFGMARYQRESWNMAEIWRRVLADMENR